MLLHQGIWSLHGFTVHYASHSTRKTPCRAGPSCSLHTVLHLEVSFSCLWRTEGVSLCCPIWSHPRKGIEPLKLQLSLARPNPSHE